MCIYIYICVCVCNVQYHIMSANIHDIITCHIKHYCIMSSNILACHHAELYCTRVITCFGIKFC